MSYEEGYAAVRLFDITLGLGISYISFLLSPSLSTPSSCKCENTEDSFFLLGEFVLTPAAVCPV
jgi:hypothetical protein